VQALKNTRTRREVFLFEMNAVETYLEDRAHLLRAGTFINATLIAPSPSTKNEARKLDPDMSQSTKGN